MSNLGPLSNLPPTERQGPRTKAPAYYAGETFHRRAVVRPDTERYPNGARPGTRDKSARRMIRKALGRAFSTIEQKILKARDVRLEVERLATNGHEARRYFEKTLALHKPCPQPATRGEIRAKKPRSAR